VGRVDKSKNRISKNSILAAILCRDLERFVRGVCVIAIRQAKIRALENTKETGASQ
jgi:hypothetical protein